MVPVSFLIPVKNEAANLPRCLASIAWADEVWVVDSQSADETAAIAEKAGAKVVQFHFNGRWPNKRNWALETLPFQATRLSVTIPRPPLRCVAPYPLPIPLPQLIESHPSPLPRRLKPLTFPTPTTPIVRFLRLALQPLAPSRLSSTAPIPSRVAFTSSSPPILTWHGDSTN